MRENKGARGARKRGARWGGKEVLGERLFLFPKKGNKKTPERVFLTCTEDASSVQRGAGDRT